MQSKKEKFIKLKRVNIARFFAFIVAMQILNLSIDTQAFRFLETKPSVGYANEINSFVEYFAEVVFDHNNAMPEYQKSAHDNLQLHKHFVVKYITMDDKKICATGLIQNTVLSSPLQKKYDYLFYKEINPPPPKA